METVEKKGTYFVDDGVKKSARSEALKDRYLWPLIRDEELRELLMVGWTVTPNNQ